MNLKQRMKHISDSSKWLSFETENFRVLVTKEGRSKFKTLLRYGDNESVENLDDDVYNSIAFALDELYLNTDASTKVKTQAMDLSMLLMAVKKNQL